MIFGWPVLPSPGLPFGQKSIVNCLPQSSFAAALSAEAVLDMARAAAASASDAAARRMSLPIILSLLRGGQAKAATVRWRSAGGALGGSVAGS